MSSPAHGSPGWSAEKEFALLMLLTDGNRKAAQQLWLRKVRIHREAPPDAGASAPKAATAKPQPAPARARAVPKLETAAQLARRERSQIRLGQKHLASKIWASVRVASRLLAWCSRSRLVKGSHIGLLACFSLQHTFPVLWRVTKVLGHCPRIV